MTYVSKYTKQERTALVEALHGAQRSYFNGDRAALTVVLALRWILGAEPRLVTADD